MFFFWQTNYAVKITPSLMNHFFNIRLSSASLNLTENGPETSSSAPRVLQRLHWHTGGQGAADLLEW